MQQMMAVPHLLPTQRSNESDWMVAQAPSWRCVLHLSGVLEGGQLSASVSQERLVGCFT